MTDINGLLHYWPLDEASGGVAEDVVSGREATIVNDVDGDTITTGKFVNARALATKTPRSFVRLYTGTNDSTESLAAWSIGLWFNHLASGSHSLSPEIITVGSYISGFNTLEVWIPVANQAQLRVRLTGPNPSYSTFLDATYTHSGNITGAVRMLIIACDGTTTSAFLDGALLGSSTGAIPLQIKSTGSVIGRGYSGSAGTFAGWVDDIQIWNKALSLTDAEGLWAAGTGQTAIDYVGGFPAPDTSWADGLTQERIYYACDIDDGILDPIRIPISSWQATIQSDRSSFAQAVVPGIPVWADALSARPNADMIIRRGVVLADGSTQEAEMARVPHRLRVDEGPTNATGTLSGYAQIAISRDPITRAARNARSLSVDGQSTRLRCDIDFFLRPGDTLTFRDLSIVVAYINYTVGNGSEYMDAGTRAL